jgi:hypothetical protein
MEDSSPEEEVFLCDANGTGWHNVFLAGRQGRGMVLCNRSGSCPTLCHISNVVRALKENHIEHGILLMRIMTDGHWIVVEEHF